MLGILSVVNYYIIGDVIKNELQDDVRRILSIKSPRYILTPQKVFQRPSVDFDKLFIGQVFCRPFFPVGLFHDESAVRKCFFVGRILDAKKRMALVGLCRIFTTEILTIDLCQCRRLTIRTSHWSSSTKMGELVEMSSIHINYITHNYFQVS